MKVESCRQLIIPKEDSKCFFIIYFNTKSYISSWICRICYSSFRSFHFSFVSIRSVNRGSWFCSHTSTNSGESSSVAVINSTQSFTVLQADCCQVKVGTWKVTLTLYLCPVTVTEGSHTYTHLFTTMQLCSSCKNNGWWPLISTH